MPFAKATLKVESADGRYFTLLEPLVYTTDAGEVIIVPEGATTDGASTPQAIWNIIPPFGTYWLAAILHDYLYRLTKRSKNECDSLLREAMASLGVDKLLRDTIYEGVHLGGETSFDDDRKLKLLIKVTADVAAMRQRLFSISAAWPEQNRTCLDAPLDGAVAQQVER